MAYSRWGYSDWYIFWHTSDAKKKEEEILAVWRADVEELPVYSYAVVKDMLAKDDFSDVLGYTPADHEFLRYIFQQWIRDVDEAYAKGEER